MHLNNVVKSLVIRHFDYSFPKTFLGCKWIRSISLYFLDLVNLGKFMKGSKLLYLNIKLILVGLSSWNNSVLVDSDICIFCVVFVADFYIMQNMDFNKDCPFFYRWRTWALVYYCPLLYDTISGTTLCNWKPQNVFPILPQPVCTSSEIHKPPTFLIAL